MLNIYFYFLLRRYFKLKTSKLSWYILDNDYTRFLKKYDDKVVHNDYNNGIKPYVGIVININDFNYYVPISSSKEKLKHMKNSLLMHKIIEHKTSKLLCVLNLGNMLPVKYEHLTPLKYSNLENYINFKNQNSKTFYIDLLQKDLKILNSLSDTIKSNAQKLYFAKEKHNKSYKESGINKMLNYCCDFKKLEIACNQFTLSKDIINNTNNLSKTKTKPQKTSLLSRLNNNKNSNKKKTNDIKKSKDISL